MVKCEVEKTPQKGDKCLKCCIYCNEKDACEYACEASLLNWSEEQVKNNCSFAS